MFHYGRREDVPGTVEDADYDIPADLKPVLREYQRGGEKTVTLSFAEAAENIYKKTIGILGEKVTNESGKK